MKTNTKHTNHEFDKTEAESVKKNAVIAIAVFLLLSFVGFRLFIQPGQQQKTEITDVAYQATAIEAMYVSAVAASIENPQGDITQFAIDSGMLKAIKGLVINKDDGTVLNQFGGTVRLFAEGRQKVAIEYSSTPEHVCTAVTAIQCR